MGHDRTVQQRWPKLWKVISVTDKFITQGFIAAGLSNILGVLICSKAFSNDVMLATQPDVMGYFGLISVILWGCAYIAVSKIYDRARWLVGLFAIEKLAYVIVWLIFVSSHSLKDIFDQDTLAGLFFSIYGINDLIFMIFFSFIFLRNNKARPKSSS